MIPTQEENPDGLHQRYYIQKIVGWEESLGRSGVFDAPVVEEIEEGAQYLVLRLDLAGHDREHIKAGRIGAHAYANAIEHLRPKLAKELREAYPLIVATPTPGAGDGWVEENGETF